MPLPSHPHQQQQQQQQQNSSNSNNNNNTNFTNEKFRLLFHYIYGGKPLPSKPSTQVESDVIALWRKMEDPFNNSVPVFKWRELLDGIEQRLGDHQITNNVTKLPPMSSTINSTNNNPSLHFMRSAHRIMRLRLSVTIIILNSVNVTPVFPFHDREVEYCSNVDMFYERMKQELLMAMNPSGPVAGGGQQQQHNNHQNSSVNNNNNNNNMNGPSADYHHYHNLIGIHAQHWKMILSNPGAIFFPSHQSNYNYNTGTSASTTTMMTPIEVLQRLYDEAFSSCSSSSSSSSSEETTTSATVIITNYERLFDLRTAAIVFLIDIARQLHEATVRMDGVAFVELFAKATTIRGFIVSKIVSKHQDRFALLQQQLQNLQNQQQTSQQHEPPSSGTNSNSSSQQQQSSSSSSYTQQQQLLSHQMDTSMSIVTIFRGCPLMGFALKMCSNSLAKGYLAFYDELGYAISLMCYDIPQHTTSSSSSSSSAAMLMQNHNNINNSAAPSPAGSPNPKENRNQRGGGQQGNTTTSGTNTKATETSTTGNSSSGGGGGLLSRLFGFIGGGSSSSSSNNTTTSASTKTNNETVNTSKTTTTTAENNMSTNKQSTSHEQSATTTTTNNQGLNKGEASNNSIDEQQQQQKQNTKKDDATDNNKNDGDDDTNNKTEDDAVASTKKKTNEVASEKRNENDTIGDNKDNTGTSRGGKDLSSVTTTRGGSNSSNKKEYPSQSFPGATIFKVFGADSMIASINSVVLNYKVSLDKIVDHQHQQQQPQQQLHQGPSYTPLHCYLMIFERVRPHSISHQNNLGYHLPNPHSLSIAPSSSDGNLNNNSIVSNNSNNNNNINRQQQQQVAVVEPSIMFCRDYVTSSTPPQSFQSNNNTTTTDDDGTSSTSNSERTGTSSSSARNPQQQQLQQQQGLSSSYTTTTFAPTTNYCIRAFISSFNQHTQQQLSPEEKQRAIDFVIPVVESHVIQSGQLYYRESPSLQAVARGEHENPNFVFVVVSHSLQDIHSREKQMAMSRDLTGRLNTFIGLWNRTSDLMKMAGSLNQIRLHSALSNMF